MTNDCSTCEGSGSIDNGNGEHSCADCYGTGRSHLTSDQLGVIRASDARVSARYFEKPATADGYWEAVQQRRDLLGELDLVKRDSDAYLALLVAEGILIPDDPAALGHEPKPQAIMKDFEITPEMEREMSRPGQLQFVPAPEYRQIGIKHKGDRTDYLWWETPPEGTPVFIQASAERTKP